MNTTMDAAALRALPRPTLQKIAKENSVKANLKSETIIELLLERRIQKAPTIHKSVSKSPHRGSTCPSSLRSPVVKVALKTAIASSSVRRTPIRRSTPNPFPADLTAEGNEGQQNNLPVEVAPNEQGDDEQSEDDLQDRYELQYPSSTYTFATPESSMPGSPEPEAAAEDLRSTVEYMATIHKADVETLKQITTLRKLAASLRSTAEDLTTRVRAERASRLRMQNYATYWRRIDPQWKYNEVWSGQLRIPPNPNAIEITTSDEEIWGNESEESPAGTEADEPPEPTEKGLRKFLARILGPQAPITPASASSSETEPEAPVASPKAPATPKAPAASPTAPAASPKVPAVSEGAPEAPNPGPTPLVRSGALEIVMQPAANGSKVNGKRRRDDAENINEDDERYRPRGRADPPSGSGAAGEPLPQSSPPRRRLNKGKAKMTPEEVEAMLKEQGGQWSVKVAPESETVKNPGDLVAYLGLSQAEIEQNLTVEALYKTIQRAEKAAGRAPAELAAPAAEITVPPVRAQRRSSRAVSKALPRK